MDDEKTHAEDSDGDDELKLPEGGAEDLAPADEESADVTGGIRKVPGNFKYTNITIKNAP